MLLVNNRQYNMEGEVINCSLGNSDQVLGKQVSNVALNQVTQD